MEQQPQDVRDRPLAPSETGVDRVIDGTPMTSGATRYRAVEPDIAISENVMPVRDRVQWGPILGGTLIALTALVVLAMLGIAVGASAFEPGTDLTDWGSGAGIWGALSLLAALFLGGWAAAKTAAVGGTFAGVMNGLLAGATTIVVLLIIASVGLSNTVGFIGGNLAHINDFSGAITGDVADADVRGAYDDIEAGAWGTVIALVLGLGAAAVGGLAGHNSRIDLVEGTGRDD